MTAAPAALGPLLVAATTQKGFNPSILIFVINFVWSTVIAREREEGNPWQSRGLEWQVGLLWTRDWP